MLKKGFNLLKTILGTFRFPKFLNCNFSKENSCRLGRTLRVVQLSTIDIRMTEERNILVVKPRMSDDMPQQKILDSRPSPHWETKP
jgi:hypothetical protein